MKNEKITFVCDKKLKARFYALTIDRGFKALIIKQLLSKVCALIEKDEEQAIELLVSGKYAFKETPLKES